MYKYPTLHYFETVKSVNVYKSDKNVHIKDTTRKNKIKILKKGKRKDEQNK